MEPPHRPAPGPRPTQGKKEKAPMAKDSGDGRPWKNANRENLNQEGVRKANMSRFLSGQIESINKTLESNSPGQNSGSSGCSARGKYICTDKRGSPLTVSDSPRTPLVQKNLPPPESESTPRDKSTTPTLTDLENSVHYDCRLDKVLRVAVDYALK